MNLYYSNERILGENDISNISSSILSKVPKYGENMVYNSYFPNVINQKGENTYSGGKYGFDGFFVESGTMSIAPGGIRFSNGTFYQRCEKEFAEFLIGKTVTLSILTVDGVLYTGTGVVNYDDTVAPCALPNGTTAMLSFFSEVNNFQIFRLYIPNGNDVTLQAVKVELGDQQTLAHQENGKWVVNEIPDPVLELTKCQRYYWKSQPGPGGYSTASLIRIFPSDAYTQFVSLVNVPVTMRAKPSLKINGKSPGENVTLRATFTNGTITGKLVNPDDFSMSKDGIMRISFEGNIPTQESIYEGTIELDAYL